MFVLVDPRVNLALTISGTKEVRIFDSYSAASDFKNHWYNHWKQKQQANRRMPASYRMTDDLHVELYERVVVVEVDSESIKKYQD